MWAGVLGWGEREVPSEGTSRSLIFFKAQLASHNWPEDSSPDFSCIPASEVVTPLPGSKPQLWEQHSLSTPDFLVKDQKED